MSYTSFKQMEAKLAQKPGVTNPAGLAAHIAAAKYGEAALQHAAKTGTSLEHVKPLHKSARGKPKRKHDKRHRMIQEFLARGR